MKISLFYKANLIIGLFLFLSGFANPDRTIVTIWLQNQDKNITDWITTIQGFNIQQEDNIFIDYRVIDYLEIENRLFSALRAGTLPDIIQINASFLNEYAQNNLFTPISPYISPYIINDMTLSNKQKGTYHLDNELYGISLFESSPILYGNKKYLEEIDARIPQSLDEVWTTREFEGYMRKLSKIPGVFAALDMQFYYQFPHWITHLIFPIFQAMGCRAINTEDDKVSGALNSEPCLQAAKKIQYWNIREWITPLDTISNILINQNRFSTLKFDNYLGNLKIQDFLSEDIAIIPFPQFGEDYIAPTSSWSFALSKNTKNPQAAGKFIEHLIRKTNFDNYVAVPGFKSIIESSPLYQKGAPLNIMVQQIEKSVPQTTRYAPYKTFTLIFSTLLSNILSGKKPETELIYASQKIDDAIAQYRRLFGSYPRY